MQRDPRHGMKRSPFSWTRGPWPLAAVYALTIACGNDARRRNPSDGVTPPTSADAGPSDVPVVRAEPTSAVGASCAKPPGEPVAADGCDEVCFSSVEGEICTTRCTPENGCPQGYECLEDLPGDQWCLPIDSRCPPSGPVVGRDLRCGCLGGVPIIQTWTCSIEQSGDMIVGSCDGYCSVSCDTDPSCPDGFSCRAATGRGTPSLRCLSDAPLEGEISERTPADMTEVAEGQAVQLRWSFAGGPDGQERAAFFDVHWGTSPDALTPHRANGFDSDTGTYNFDAAELQAGRQFYWKIVATGNGGLQAESPVWSFSVGEAGPVQTPCPDAPTVTIDGRQVGTVQIQDKCWTKGSFAVGETLGGATTDTYFDDGRVQYGTYSSANFYAWWEAHNAYPLNASQEPSPNLVGSSICPDGWRLPTRAEWQQAIQLGNEMRPDRQSSALDYGWIGWFPPVNNGVSRCPRPGGNDEVICGRFADWLNSGTFLFLVGPSTSPTSVPIIAINRPAGGSSDYTIAPSNSGSPWAGYQLRCVRD